MAYPYNQQVQLLQDVDSHLHGGKTREEEVLYSFFLSTTQLTFWRLLLSRGGRGWGGGLGVHLDTGMPPVSQNVSQGYMCMDTSDPQLVITVNGWLIPRPPYM